MCRLTWERRRCCCWCAPRRLETNCREAVRKQEATSKSFNRRMQQLESRLEAERREKRVLQNALQLARARELQHGNTHGGNGSDSGATGGSGSNQSQSLSLTDRLWSELPLLLQHPATYQGGGVAPPPPPRPSGRRGSFSHLVPQRMPVPQVSVEPGDPGYNTDVLQVRLRWCWSL